MPFTKGDPNINRNGRPKGISITEMVKEALEKVDLKDDEKRTRADMVVQKIYDKAVVEGDTAMLKAIWAYIDGQPKQESQVNGFIEVKGLENF